MFVGLSFILQKFINNCTNFFILSRIYLYLFLWQLNICSITHFVRLSTMILFTNMVVVINLFIYLCIYLQAYHGTSRSVVWKLTEPDFAWLKNHKIKVPHGRLSFNIQDLLKEVFIQLIPSTKFIREKSQNLYVISAVVGGEGGNNWRPFYLPTQHYLYLFRLLAIPYSWYL